MSKPSNVWIVGDIQGCCGSLRELLAQPAIAQDSGARFWFAGDLVNRGPQSLETLNLIHGMGDRSVAVLGNHDLHLLAVAAGIKKPGKSDTIAEVLNAPNADELIDWLRHRPLAHYEHGHLMVHAGVLAAWDLDKTLSLAAEVEKALRSADWKSHLKKMYGNEPVGWNDGLSRDDRRRVIINALTRMRMCTSQGHMDFSYKHAPIQNDRLMPWFDVPDRAILRDGVTVVFGHWSTLGLLVRPDAICLDTGCIWGGKLTALRLHDHQLLQIDCEQHQKPGGDS